MGGLLHRGEGRESNDRRNESGIDIVPEWFRENADTPRTSVDAINNRLGRRPKVEYRSAS